MTDAELIGAVTEARGMVIVGFKDAFATDGVDNEGRILASSDTAACSV